MGYSEKVMEHFMHPRNVGRIEDAAGVGRAGNPICGDIMTIYIKVKDNVITDVKFETFGCGAAIATSSMVTELVKGKAIEEALKITNRTVADAVEDGLVLIEHLKERWEKSKNIRDCVIEGAKWKLRPILMTTITTIFALLPIMFSRGVGSEIMKPIAAPVVGGMITATILNLILVPVLFAGVKEWETRKKGV